MSARLLMASLCLVLLAACEEASESNIGSTDSKVQEVCGTEETYSNPATFCQIQQALLIPKCLRCHDGGHRSIGDAEYDEFMDSDWVVPGDPDSSIMFIRMVNGNITDTVITEEETDAVESWILDGALDN